MKKVTFVGPLEINSILLEGALNLSKEEQVPLDSFIIYQNGTEISETQIGEGKYKSAMLLVYLCWHSGKQETFTIDKDLVTKYYGYRLCNNALYNPDTKHDTIRDLLFDGDVSVKLTLKEYFCYPIYG